ncbi:MAG: PilZ domain-containing protein [Gammaproteobacteria bacterium]|nr:PilZ domain-containing protein [Gammaproteobacteria bacterium]
MPSTPQEPSAVTFRIDDELYLDVQPLGVEEGDEALAWRHDTSGFCDGLIRLREIGLQSGHILAAIRKHHPDIGNYLALLDKKIDILAQLVGTVGLGGEITPTHRVSLGVQGMSFDSTTALAPQSALALKLVLFPSHLCLHLQAKVLSCEAKGAGYRVELEFGQMDEIEREALIRHLLETQSAALRRRRDT